VDVIKQMKNLGETDKEKVLGGNAMKMFGLNGNGAAKTEGGAAQGTTVH